MVILDGPRLSPMRYLSSIFSLLLYASPFPSTLSPFFRPLIYTTTLPRCSTSPTALTPTYYRELSLFAVNFVSVVFDTIPKNTQPHTNPPHLLPSPAFAKPPTSSLEWRHPRISSLQPAWHTITVAARRTRHSARSTLTAPAPPCHKTTTTTTRARRRTPRDRLRQQRRRQGQDERSAAPASTLSRSTPLAAVAC